MVGILFVFLLMLTVFALNLRESEDVSKRKYDEKVAQLDAARLAAEKALAKAEKAEKLDKVDKKKPAAAAKAAAPEPKAADEKPSPWGNTK